MQQQQQQQQPDDPAAQVSPRDVPIRVDDVDLDSSYGDDHDAQSETTSLYSAITKYVYQNGRRYHSYREGTYWGPNDENAQDNLDLFHHIFTLALNGSLFLAPISPNPQRVLDLGTGTGIWAIDFADAFPSASVVATDLSPIQPSDVPPNLEFQIDDFTQPWTFTPASFDFVHARSIYGSVASFPSLYQEVRAHLKPGGWFEQAEISVIAKSEDGSIAGTRIEEWGPIAWECGEKFGKSFKIAEDSKDLMEQAGFVNVRRHTFRWPIGTWPMDKKMKEIGAYNRLAWDEGINGWAMFLMTNFLGWRAEEVQVLCAQIRNDLRNKHIHAYQDMTVVYGQRPWDSEANSMTEVEHDFPAAQTQAPNVESPRGEFSPSRTAKASSSNTGTLDVQLPATAQEPPTQAVEITTSVFDISAVPDLPKVEEVPSATEAPTLITQAMDLDTSASDPRS